MVEWSYVCVSLNPRDIDSSWLCLTLSFFTLAFLCEGGDSLRKPKPVKKVSCTIDKLQVTLHPNVERFEEELCKLINSDRILREEVTSDKGVVQVAERRLHVGIHNGWGYVDSPQIMMLDADKLSRGGNRGSKRMGKKGISGSR
eukprot:XP_011667857.1 PREDICTED: nephrocystin-4-like [Strongylocentrotus purpuratus]